MTREECEIETSKAIMEMRKRIAELEKENAELKEKLGDVQMQKAGEKSDLVWKLMTANEQKADQLTKAKEIIREFVEWATWQGSNCPNFKSIQDKAEQFLKENEE